MFYFDHNATSPIAPEVLTVLQRTQSEVFGNPSSIHQTGQRARHAVETARGQVAAFLGCTPREVVFTSGGTESDNLAVFGAGPGHVITSAVEHPAVLSSVRQLDSYTILPVDSQGVVDPDAVRAALRPDTRLISIMHANNETGVIQPIEAISAIAREAGVLFHSDGVQAAGRVSVQVKDLGIDLYSLSAHKLGASKGAGALYVRDGVKLAARQFGGRHERERRAGTENVPGVAALGAATTLPPADLARLRDRLESAIVNHVPVVHVQSAAAARLNNTSNICFEGIEAEALVIALDLAGFAVATGAACSSGAVEPSHVLLAMGLSPAQAKSSIRFSLGRTNTVEQVDALAAAVAQSVARLRRLSPVTLHA